MFLFKEKFSMLDQIPDYLLLLYSIYPDIIAFQHHWILVLWQLMVHFLVEFSHVYKYTIPWFKKKMLKPVFTRKEITLYSGYAVILEMFSYGM